MWVRSPVRPNRPAVGRGHEPSDRENGDPMTARFVAVGTALSLLFAAVPAGRPDPDYVTKRRLLQRPMATDR